MQEQLELLGNIFTSSHDGYESGGGNPQDQQCECEQLRQHNAVILGVTIPIIILYVMLMVVGVSNVLRFWKVNSMSKYLGMIYFWSLMSNSCCALYLAVCQLPNTVQYLPYMIAMYAKILVGIAYQASIFDLQLIVNFYFSDAKKATSSEVFEKRRNMVMWVMAITSTLVLIYFFVDFYYNYLLLDFFDVGNQTVEADPVPGTMIAEYYFVGAMYLILTVMLVWLTCLITSNLKEMGQLLQNERQRLLILMIVFFLSYLGSSVYYVYQVASKLHCTAAQSCVRYQDLMLSAFVSMFCDVIPMIVLYYQHYQISSESLKQMQNQQRKDRNESITASDNETQQTNLDNRQSYEIKVIGSQPKPQHQPNKYDVVQCNMSPSNQGLFIGEGETLSGLSDNVNTMSKSSFVKTVLGTVKGPSGTLNSSSSGAAAANSLQVRRSRSLTCPEEVFGGVDERDVLVQDQSLMKSGRFSGENGVMATSQSFAESHAMRPPMLLQPIDEEDELRRGHSSLRATLTKEVPIWLGPASAFIRVAQEHKASSSNPSSFMINQVTVSDGTSSLAIRDKKTMATTMEKKIFTEQYEQTTSPKTINSYDKRSNSSSSLTDSHDDVSKVTSVNR